MMASSSHTDQDLITCRTLFSSLSFHQLSEDFFKSFFFSKMDLTYRPVSIFLKCFWIRFKAEIISIGLLAACGGPTKGHVHRIKMSSINPAMMQLYLYSYLNESNPNCLAHDDQSFEHISPTRQPTLKPTGTLKWQASTDMDERHAFAAQGGGNT